MILNAEICERLIALHSKDFNGKVTCHYDKGYGCFIVRGEGDPAKPKFTYSYQPRFARIAIAPKS